MFGIDSSELLVIVIIAVIVIGPKDLPRALYKVGQIVGKAQGMARHFRTGIDAMVREVELEELEKKWAAQNKRIMDEHPPETAASLPSPDPEGHPSAAAQSAEAEVHPPVVAEPSPPAFAPAAAAEGPPYLAGVNGAPVRKGDAAA
ncbi:twin-arginine translocase subunit TatB [Sphingobium amiense]|uniref:Twin-arginine translocase subunit TatB n=1 Tax=Sphingobium amiense TaxID=135719 RepID=A0A494WCG8_9SPHN|nr:Sec-independent protein translocase protein TatB [Sphingobium amiense]BBD98510.1 twin-arginine translocase subunit TatB [Sphingobium amiense]